VFATGEGGGFLDADQIIFETEIGIDITLFLEMAADDSGTIFEPEGPTGRNEGMVETPKSATADVVEVFEIGFADFSNEEAFEARIALAIIGADLRKEPMGFTAPAGAAVTDEGGTFGIVTEAGGSAGLELTGVEADPSAFEVDELIVRTAKALAQRSVGDIKRGAVHNLKRSAGQITPFREAHPSRTATDETTEAPRSQRRSGSNTDFAEDTDKGSRTRTALSVRGALPTF